MIHIIFAIILNILLALYAKSIFDKKIAERKRKNEEEARMREAGELQTNDDFDFEVRPNSSRNSKYNPNALRENR